MKKVIAIMVVLTLVLAAVSNGKDSPKGGSVGKGESFKIDVPSSDTKVKPGETQTVTIKGPRGTYLTARVADPSRLTQVHIGDTIVITYTEALAVSLEKTQKTSSE